MENVDKSTHNLDEVQFCRLCLSVSEKLVNYFDDHELQILLTACCGISTEIAGKRPKFVCPICVKFLELCGEFRHMCMEAESTLVNYSKTGTWQNTVEVPEWLIPVQYRRSQQDDAVSAKNSGYETIDEIESLSVQSPTISSESAFEFSAEYSNTGSEVQPTTQPDAQHKPSPVQVTGLQAVSSYPKLLQQSERAGTPKPPELQVSPSKQPIVLRYTQFTSRPVQPIPPLTPIAGIHHCTICSLDFANKNQLQQHAIKHNNVDLILCWCGKLIAQFSAVVCHLLQHKEIPWCVLCGEDLSSLQHLYQHLDLHMKVGSLHRCGFCRLIFLDQNSRLQHIGEKHYGDLLML